MEDVLKSIKAFLYQRSVSPLFGAFMLSWALWNYQFILILFSSENINEKLTLLDEYFPPIEIFILNNQIVLPTEIINGFAVPLFLALFYIFGYPYFAKPVYRFSLRKQIEMNKLKQNESKEKLLTEQESRKLLEKISEIQDRYFVDIEKLQTQNSALINALTKLKLQVQEEQLRDNEDSYINNMNVHMRSSDIIENNNYETIPNIFDNVPLNDDDLRILTIINSLPAQYMVGIEPIKLTTNYSSSEIHDALEKLINKNFLKHTKLSDDENAFGITPEGIQKIKDYQTGDIID